MIRYQLPDTETLISLGEEHQDAITIYVKTDPTPEGRERAKTVVKSGVDEAMPSFARTASSLLRDRPPSPTLRCAARSFRYRTTSFPVNPVAP